MDNKTIPFTLSYKSSIILQTLILSEYKNGFLIEEKFCGYFFGVLWKDIRRFSPVENHWKIWFFPSRMNSYTNKLWDAFFPAIAWISNVLKLGKSVLFQCLLFRGDVGRPFQGKLWIGLNTKKSSELFCEIYVPFSELLGARKLVVLLSHSVNVKDFFLFAFMNKW